MRTFQFFIEDDRYSAPTFALVTVSDEKRARELASARLAESAHHLSVEVRLDEQVVFVARRAGPTDFGAAAPAT